jgi:5-methylcytosine-specific restriction endonuclease McrA
MSKHKKIVRQEFRDAVFKRDKYVCAVCNVKDEHLDAHHITDRTLMPNGGYVKENGISLCAKCHILAENHWNGGNPQLQQYEPDALYSIIGSSVELATEASEKLK